MAWSGLLVLFFTMIEIIIVAGFGIHREYDDSSSDLIDMFFRSAPPAARGILFFGTREKGNRLDLSVNESKCE